MAAGDLVPEHHLATALHGFRCACSWLLRDAARNCSALCGTGHWAQVMRFLSVTACTRAGGLQVSARGMQGL